MTSNEKARGFASLYRSLRFKEREEASQGLRQGLTEEERYRVADDVVNQLQGGGDPWRLSEPFAGNDGQRIFGANELAGSNKWLGLRSEALSRGYHGRVDCTKPARRQSF